jgi:hypothetical protein
MAPSKQAEERRIRLARLEEWIELANFFAPHDLLPEEPSKRLLDDVWKQWRSWAKSNRGARFFWAHEIETNWHGRLGGNYLSKGAAREVYQLLRTVREALDGIANQFEAARARLEHKSSPNNQLEPDVEPDDDAPSDDWEPVSLPPLIPLGWLNPRGVIDYSYGPVGEFLDSLKGIKARKLRHCRKCERLFYASRSDKWTCSVQCQAAYRMQEWRKKGKEYEVKRQRNRKDGITELNARSAAARLGENIGKKNQREPVFQE